VVRVDLRGSPTGLELLERVKRQTVGAQANQDIPFEQVVELVQPLRSTAHSPVFQAMFAWENTPRARLALAGVQVMPLGGEAAAVAKFDVALGLREQGGEIVGGLTYAAALYEKRTMERHVEYLRNLLQGLVGDASAMVEQLPMSASGGAAAGERAGDGDPAVQTAHNTKPLSIIRGSSNVIS